MFTRLSRSSRIFNIFINDYMNPLTIEKNDFLIITKINIKKIKLKSITDLIPSQAS